MDDKEYNEEPYKERYRLTISYDEWVDYIGDKKLALLQNIDKTSFLDNSIENNIFISILKKIFTMDIFNLSRISYLAFSFLDIYINENLQTIINIDKYNLGTYIQNRQNKQSSKFICLTILINLIIHIEFTLNLHLFIIIYIANSNANSNAQESILEDPKISKPKILFKIEKICNDLKANIKSSTIILLLLKINKKLGDISDICIWNDFILKEQALSKQLLFINNKMKYLLDNFILAIAKNNLFQNNITNTKANTQANTQVNTQVNTILERYELCINYILDLANILYTYFDIAFAILIKYLQEDCKQTGKPPENSKQLDIVKNSISDLLKSEITALENKFFDS